MIKVERQMKVELTQGKLLNALSENNSSGKFYSEREEEKLVDIGEMRGDTPHRIIVGNGSAMAEIFPQSIAENASSVVSVMMSQDEFVREVSPNKIEGVIDIGYVDKHNGVTRTVIGTEGQIQIIFPNIELPPDAAK